MKSKVISILLLHFSPWYNLKHPLCKMQITQSGLKEDVSAPHHATFRGTVYLHRSSINRGKTQ